MTSERTPSGPDIHDLDHEGVAEAEFLHGDGQYRIMVEQVAWDSVQAHAAENSEFEVCGVLVGELFRDEHGPHLVVKDCIRGRMAHQASDHVTFTHSTWEHIHNEKDEKHPDLRVVGWYHTHPGIGVFLSEPDLFAHRSFFDAAWQVAMVVDPKAGREGIFYWEGGKVVRARRYWVGGEARWEPPERPATSAPPGTTRTVPSNATEDPEAAVGETGWWDSPAYRLAPLVALPILLVLLLLLQWNTRSDTNALARDVQAWRFEMALRGGDPDVSLAREMASWVRGRLDEGQPAGGFLEQYRLILRLDPRRADAYKSLLPELAALEEGG